MSSSSKIEASLDQATPAGSRPVHGGIRPSDLRALGLNPQDVLDFSASISPLGPPQSLWPALQQVDLTAYPDPECLELREALSQHLGVGIDSILVGNGSTELIHLLARAYLSEKESALLLTPTYGEYAGACRLSGASALSLPAQRETGFSWDLEQAGQIIADEKPRLVFLCNPNNPTGVYLPPPEVEYLADATGQAGGLLALDEAYLSFVDETWDSRTLLADGNVVLLRSMTKDYALTGLRLGYSLASTEVTVRLAAFQPDWSVNGLAQAAGLVALADAGYLPRAREAVNQSKEYLTSQLTG
ncbi:MAG: pyridoxal phosphate-dependent aminotransferase, partial [Dehalococcoidia bacterium]